MKFYIFSAVLMIFVLLAGVSGYFLFASKNATKTNNSPLITISGTFDINGVIPAGSTLSVIEKDYPQSKASHVVVSNIPAVDNDTWSFGNVTAGKSYEVTAELRLNGTILATSSPIVVSAPAHGEKLILNITSSNGNAEAAISGTIQVNGYIPPGAKVIVRGRKLGAPAFSDFVTLPGEGRQTMTYAEATAGQSYEVVAQLFDSKNNQIGASSTLVVTAPAIDEILTINSQATPQASPLSVSPTSGVTAAQTTTSTSVTSTPTPTSVPTNTSISGSIHFNGIAPINSRIVVFERVSGVGTFQVAVDNILPVDGTTWTWGQAQAGTGYDLIAVLKQRQSNGGDLDIASSTGSSITAPASTITFTINSSITLSAPGGPISVTCDNISGTTWNTHISLGGVNGARSFWYQIGVTSGGIERANSTQNVSSNTALSIPITLTNGTTYYVAYAYATVPNLQANNAQYSPFSSIVQIRCNQ